MSYIETVMRCIDKIRCDYCYDMINNVKDARWYFDMADGDFENILGTSESAYVIGEIDEVDIDNIKNAIIESKEELIELYYTLRNNRNTLHAM